MFFTLYIFLKNIYNFDVKLNLLNNINKKIIKNKTSLKYIYIPNTKYFYHTKK